MKLLKAMKLGVSGSHPVTIIRGSEGFQRLTRSKADVCGRRDLRGKPENASSVESRLQVQHPQRYTGTTVGRPHWLTSIETDFDVAQIARTHDLSADRIGLRALKPELGYCLSECIDVGRPHWLTSIETRGFRIVRELHAVWSADRIGLRALKLKNGKDDAGNHLVGRPHWLTSIETSHDTTLP